MQTSKGLTGPSKGLTTPSQFGRIMPFTLSKTLTRQGFNLESATARDVLDAIAASEPDPPIVLRCMNPICINTCEWTESRGRTPKFCSKACNQQHETTRERLLEEVAIIQAAIDRPNTGYTHTRLLIRERSKRLFALFRYPDVREPQGKKEKVSLA